MARYLVAFSTGFAVAFCALAIWLLLPGQAGLRFHVHQYFEFGEAGPHPSSLHHGGAPAPGFMHFDITEYEAEKVAAGQKPLLLDGGFQVIGTKPLALIRPDSIQAVCVRHMKSTSLIDEGGDEDQYYVRLTATARANLVSALKEWRGNERFSLPVQMLDRYRLILNRGILSKQSIQAYEDRTNVGSLDQDFLFHYRKADSAYGAKRMTWLNGAKPVESCPPTTGL